MARTNRTTLSNVLLASVEPLLFRYSDQQEFTLGLPIANRNRPECMNLIGFFSNTQVLCAGVAPEATFLQLLQDVAASTSALHLLQHVRYEELMRRIHAIKGDRAHPFRIVWAFQNVPQASRHQSNVTFEQVELRETGITQFSLECRLWERHDGLHIRLIGNTDYFEKSTIRHWLNSWETLLRAAIASPSTVISRLPVLNEDEWRKAVLDWGCGAVLLRDWQGGVGEEFARKAASVPNAIALEWQERQLTYRELHERAAKMARYLRRMGVGPEVRVAVCLERSPDLIIALLGIAIAGGAYVPLDPAYPAERLSYMLERFTGAGVVDAADHAQSAAGPPRRDDLEVDQEEPEIEVQNAEPLESLVAPENLAYLIYTSGSTGNPKAVGVTHSGFCHLALAQQRDLRSRAARCGAAACFDQLRRGRLGTGHGAAQRGEAGVVAGGASTFRRATRGIHQEQRNHSCNNSTFGPGNYSGLRTI